ncbi:hypothetical protein SPBR_05414 [Sporothrix brasiliensis 5110]|uniref:Cyanovirin-N domain-containing protein n=1 Tax=Sporothrix brasiliensis 5110 TaxID=1398154 RepID=A0A0C2F9J6_9PEZI|nr:uncharacterized protein SPBR_05414 [Sporothrix brasiliensis 5110]KIH87753.1 hypothetical protein SPBR_05414 [Sporothrix brasiliensis 5110]
MSVIFMRIAAAIGVLLHVTLSTAEFTSLCSDVYLDKNDANILVTRCTMNGEPSDSHYVWSEFDLNKILGYQAPYIIYQKKYVATPLHCARQLMKRPLTDSGNFSHVVL